MDFPRSWNIFHNNHIGIIIWKNVVIGKLLTGAFYVGLLDGKGWGVAGIIITSDDWDHSRKFPAFSTSKIIWKNMVIMVQYNVVCLIYWQ